MRRQQRGRFSASCTRLLFHTGFAQFVDLAAQDRAADDLVDAQTGNFLAHRYRERAPTQCGLNACEGARENAKAADLSTPNRLTAGMVGRYVASCRRA